MAHNAAAYLVAFVLTLHVFLLEAVSDATQSGQFLPSHLSAEARRYSIPSPGGTADSDVKIFIGIFTRPDPHQGATNASTFAARRDVLRATTLAGLRRFGAHVAVRFVVGLPPFAGDSQTAPWQALRDEAARHQDFMDLPVPERETHKAQKAMLFFSSVVQRYPSVELVVKAEDGAYVQPQRLMMAADQWAAMGADYIGCMGFSRVGGHEEYAHLLSDEYPMRAINPIYALSRRAADSVARNAGRLRLLGAADDASVALWMLRITAKYFDDQRLCAPSCRNNTVALAARRPGVSDALRLMEAAADAECAAEAAWPLPYSAVGEEELLKQRVRVLLGSDWLRRM